MSEFSDSTNYDMVEQLDLADGDYADNEHAMPLNINLNCLNEVKPDGAVNKISFENFSSK